MEEDDDRFLLSSLGVTSANPADIEQTILDEVIFCSFVYLCLVLAAALLILWMLSCLPLEFMTICSCLKCIKHIVCLSGNGEIR